MEDDELEEPELERSMASDGERCPPDFSHRTLPGGLGGGSFWPGQGEAKRGEGQQGGVPAGSGVEVGGASGGDLR